MALVELLGENQLIQCLCCSVFTPQLHALHLELFYQGGGQTLYYYAGGTQRGQCKRWQYLEAMGHVFKLNKGNGGQLFTASKAYFHFVWSTLLLRGALYCQFMGRDVQLYWLLLTFISNQPVTVLLSNSQVVLWKCEFEKQHVLKG